MVKTDLRTADFDACALEAEWLVTIDTPTAGVDNVLDALQAQVPLKQGHYDCCSYVRSGGQQRFRCLEGSHAGAEGTVQSTAASQIVVSVPRDLNQLQTLFEVVFKAHVNEEPTIRVQEVWGSRSKLLDDKDNPNRYWNRPDAKTIHGTNTGYSNE